MKDKVNIYLCDDNQDFINNAKQILQSILERNKRSYEITTFCNGTDLIEQFNKNIADVIFLDIDMPILTGFEVADELQKIKKDIIIIFITSHEDKVYQSWEFQPFWFVRKSHLEDLNIVFSKLLIKIDSQREKERCLFNLIAENKIIEININTVKYIEAYNHYIIIKDLNNKELQVRCRISDAEQQLSYLYFVRIQNSVIVNCRFISKVTSRAVILHNNEKINISRDKVDYVKNEFQKFMRSR